MKIEEEPYFFGQFDLTQDRGCVELKNLSGVNVARSIFLSPLIPSPQGEITKTICLIDPAGDIYPVVLVISSLFPVDSSAQSNSPSQTLEEKMAFFEDLRAKYDAEFFLRMQNASLHLSCPYMRKNKKRYENKPLTYQNLVELIWEIESIKEAKLQEAQDKKEYVRVKILLSGFAKKMMVEFSPEGRENEALLGRIDIRTGHLGKGSIKNVFRLHHYQKEIETAGLYVHLNNKAKRDCFGNERKIETLIQHYYEQQKKQSNFQERLAVSLCFEKRKKDDLEKIKAIQKEGITLHALHITNTFPSGEVYTDAMCLTFIKDILIGLGQLKVLEIKHRDIKPLNILIVYSEKEKRYVAMITDFDRATKDSKSKQITGSWGYAAPEMFLNKLYGKEISLLYVSDLYGLGISFLLKKHPWWQVDTKQPCNREILFDQCNNGWKAHQEPCDKKSIDWGIWKLSHPSLAVRFCGVEDAQEYFNSITF